MAKEAFYGPLERVTDFCWRIPKSYKAGMRVDGLIYADDQMIEHRRNFSSRAVPAARSASLRGARGEDRR